MLLQHNNPWIGLIWCIYGTDCYSVTACVVYSSFCMTLVKSDFHKFQRRPSSDTVLNCRTKSCTLVFFGFTPADWWQITLPLRFILIQNHSSYKLPKTIENLTMCNKKCERKPLMYKWVIVTLTGPIPLLFQLLTKMIYAKVKLIAVYIKSPKSDAFHATVFSDIFL